MYNSHPVKLWASPPTHISNYLVLWEQWFLSIDNSGSRLGLSTGQVESISGSNRNLTMISTAWSSTYGCWIRSELTMMDHKGGWDGDRLLETPSHPPKKKKMPTCLHQMVWLNQNSIRENWHPTRIHRFLKTFNSWWNHTIHLKWENITLEILNNVVFLSFLQKKKKIWKLVMLTILR